MKRFFSKSKSSQPAVPTSAPLPVPVPAAVSLQPKFVVPPLPHPCPYASINVLVTADGLMLRPGVHGHAHTVSHVKISWGKDAAVDEVDGDMLDWTTGTSVYGIVGILRLFYARKHLTYWSLPREQMLETVRTLYPAPPLADSRQHEPVFNEFRTVYRVDGVSAIPLEETRATAMVNMLAARNTPITSAAPLSTTLARPESRNGSEESGSQQTHEEAPPSLHVTFAPEQPRNPSPSLPLDADEQDLTSPPSPASSGSTTPNSPFPTSPIAKVLAARLSFWSRMSKRAPNAPADEIEPTLDQEPLSPATIDSLERRMENGEGPAEVLDSILAATAPAPSTTEERHSELDDKIVRETIKEFVKGGMYFSYNFDITTPLQRKQQRVAKLKRRSTLLSDLHVDEQPRGSLSDGEADIFSEPQPTLPLWRRVDRKFWWNESLSRPFVEAGLHSYVLPIMQGYYQIASFRAPSPEPPVAVPPTDEGDDNNEPDYNDPGGYLVDYVVVSRRSRDRAGLRYQRRGIDDEANVANFVETETIMRIKREGRSNVFSYIQIRGSIPLFWTQTGYGLKPAPQLSTERTPDQSLDALKRHLGRTVSTYGQLAIINLAEQHGKEGIITTAFRENMQELDSNDSRYHEYDFHAETKGMRYENISKLIVQLTRTFESQGFFWVSDGVVMSKQKGVYRVNCIDCLDRTNVMQSAFARHVLHNQLEAVAVLNANIAGDRTEADVVFNDVWANNGDAISRAYAGTSALKGDFTRTGKRDLGGMFNDGLNSLSRVYTSTFSDWFSQAVIDFLLGNRTLSVFSEFLLKLSSTDPRELIRISKIRAAAIETCASRVLFEGEKQVGGWTLFSPLELNTKLGDKYEEKVLLLTGKALYMVSYDYNLEKVKLFTRIPLGDIVGIAKGTYILSPLEEASRSPADNCGFVISYLPSRLTTRVTSYSMRNTVNGTTPDAASSTSTPRLSRLLSTRRTASGSTSLSKILSNVAFGTGNAVISAAFKALPVDHATSAPADVEDPVASATTCRDAVDVMVDMIRKGCVDVGSGTQPGFVVEKDIVSLAEAQRMTTMYAKLEYNFKRLLWLGS